MSDSLAVRPDSYDPRYFAEIAAVEDRHFWFTARNRLIREAVLGIVKDLPDKYRVIEVGCGTGVVLRELAKVCDRGEVIGLDLYPEAVAFASKRSGCRVIVGDVTNPPVTGEFDVVGLFDVLEHLNDEAKTLEALRCILKPHGTLVLTVPAHMSLWSYFDVAAHHCRRYDKASLISVLEKCGFEVEYLTEFMVFLFPVLWTLRRLKGGTAKLDATETAKRTSGELKVVPILNSVLHVGISLERFAIRHRWRLPVGSSVLAIAHKR